MIEAIAETAARQPVDGPSPIATAAPRTDSAEFDAAFAGALRPPEDGGCQCDARAAAAPGAEPMTQANVVRVGAASMSPALPQLLSTAVSDAALDVARADDAPRGVPGGGDGGTCGSCGLLFSVDDGVSEVRAPTEAVLPAVTGVPLGWATSSGVRIARTPSFES